MALLRYVDTLLLRFIESYEHFVPFDEKLRSGRVWIRPSRSPMEQSMERASTNLRRLIQGFGALAEI